LAAGTAGRCRRTPTTEFETEADDAPERTAAGESGELLHAGQMDLVLHHAVLEAALARLLHQRKRAGRGRCERLFAIDVLAGGNRALQRSPALAGCSRIEENRMIAACKRGVEIGAPVGDVVRPRNGREAFGIAADQEQSGQQAVIAEREAAFVDDREERIGEVLGRADAAGRAVDDDPDRLLRHHRCSTRKGLSPGGKDMAARLCYSISPNPFPENQIATPHRLPHVRF
jgi:hypothetical protein